MPGLVFEFGEVAGREVILVPKVGVARRYLHFQLSNQPMLVGCGFVANLS